MKGISYIVNKNPEAERYFPKFDLKLMARECRKSGIFIYYNNHVICVFKILETDGSWFINCKRDWNAMEAISFSG